jgi:osmoprotectant transport system substrate-binding protein
MTPDVTLPRLRRTGVAAVVASALLAISACGSDDPLAPGGGSDDGEGDSTIVVGSANFPENELLAEMYAGVLEATGMTVEKRLNIGAREAYIPALQNGEINVLPEYTGALLEYFEAEPKSSDPAGVYAELQQALPDDLTLLEPSAAEDKTVLVVSQETAQEFDLETLEDLVPIADQLTLGGAPEFRTRRAGLVGLKDVYGLEFGDFKSLDPGGPLTKSALADGSIDVGNLFSTDSSIVTDGYVALEDTENLFLAQQITPVLQDAVVTPEVQEALNGLSAALTTENLTAALAQVTEDKMEPADVAQTFLEENGLL